MHLHKLSLFVLVGCAAVSVGQTPLDAVVVHSGFTSPLLYLTDTVDPSVKYVVQQDGMIKRIQGGSTTTILTIATSYAPGSERGLLGMALAPNFASTGHFYVNYTDVAGNTQISRYTMGPGGTVNPASAFPILNIVQPFPNHNGGTVRFGPDGFLYIGMGDGGAANDPLRNAQNPNSLLGKMLRIDPTGDDFAADPTRNYSVPSTNPFFGSNGPVQAADEIWHFGLRNPYKFSFDSDTGAMLIADVGQNLWEEVDYAGPGVGAINFGWVLREGAHDNPNAPAGSALAYGPATDPIHEYAIPGSQAITGGYVYRGSSLGDFYDGRYFFADFISGQVWSFQLQVNGGSATAFNLIEHTGDLGDLGNISSIDVDQNGELYIVSFDGNIYRLQPVPEPGTMAALGLGAAALIARRRRKATKG